MLSDLTPAGVCSGCARQVLALPRPNGNTDLKLKPAAPAGCWFVVLINAKSGEVDWFPFIFKKDSKEKNSVWIIGFSEVSPNSPAVGAAADLR